MSDETARTGFGEAQGDERTRRWALSKGWRLFLVISFFFCGFALLGYGAAFFLRFNEPDGFNFGTTTVVFTTSVQHGTVHITIQTVGSIGFGPHPTWVSYMTKTPQSGKYVHMTQWQVPPFTRIILTNHEYDGSTPLRNPFWSKVTGVKGTVELVNGRPVGLVKSKASPGPTTSLEASFDVAHTFTIPQRGINVPWFAVTTTKTPTLCPVAPCTPNYPHKIDKVVFTSGPVAQYHWQCFIPCGLGYLDGNGGPMQSIGYMGGFLKVTPRGHLKIHVGQ